MPTRNDPITTTLLRHIHALSVEIGPRGSTTPGERRGAEYCAAEFQRAGLTAVIESFRSARSIFHPHLFGSLLMLAAFALYPFGGPTGAWIAFAVSALVLASELLELGFKDNPLRRAVPKGESQNAVAVVPPSGEHRQDLILIGHIDTQRTPLIFRSPRWVAAYQNFVTVVFVLFVVQMLLFLTGAITRADWVWYAAIPSALGAALLAAICIQAELTPFTAGANDNATAVSMVLTLAEQFSRQPLRHTRVYFACTGCEEVQHYGATDFFKRRRAEMLNPKALVFEMLGCAGPAWETQEGIIVPFRPHPALLKLAEDTAAAHPEWNAYPVKITGGNSELADCVRFDVPALTLFGMTRENIAPYWHQVGDTYDKMDPLVLGNTYQMVREIIASLDECA